MRYLKRRWAQCRGDQLDSWGHSEWLFETTEDGTVLRQIESYDAGPTLRYGPDRPTDQYGMLAVEPLDLDEFAGCDISADQFEAAWKSGR